MNNRDALKREYLEALIIQKQYNIENSLEQSPNLPMNLYKYVSLTGHLDNELDQIKLNTLENNELFVSSILNFNDPYDCAFNMDISEEVKKALDSMHNQKLNKCTNRNERRKVQSKLRNFSKKEKRN